jgi:D-glycero-alpha-D-manno-heptose-7-phosphate kinase
VPSQTVRSAGRGLELLHSEESRSSRTVRSRAPLRLGLAGGGTDVSPYSDVYGGIVLNATINRYCYATIEGRTDGRVLFRAADLNQQEELGGVGNDLPLHRAAYQRICRQFSLGEPALSITTLAEAPPGSGLGLSSALVVSLVEAFREYFSLPLGEYDVARLAYSIERDDCKLIGGRQDQYAATFGGFNVMEFGTGDRVIINPLRLKSAIIQEFEASLLLFYTGTSRESANIIDVQSAHIRNGSMAQIEATHTLVKEALAMKEALLTGDLPTLAAIMETGWASKRKLAAGISTDEVEHVFDVALNAGALAGKVSGAGGGGFITFLVEPMIRPQLLTALSTVSSGNASLVHFVLEGAVAWTVR